MSRYFAKIILILLFVDLSYAGLSSVGRTFASFNDTEILENNIYQAGTLDFLASSPQDNFGPRQDIVLNMMPGDSVTRLIKIKNEGSLDFQYNSRAEKISGDDDFCIGLQLIAKLNGEVKYNGDLINFVFLESLLTAGSKDKWLFVAYLPYESNFINKTCQFDFVFNGWQTNIVNYGDSGFFDEERIGNIISSMRSDEDSPTPEKENLKSDISFGAANHIVINEARIAGQTASDEFVELYNPTDSEIDISGWKLQYKPAVKGEWNNKTGNNGLPDGSKIKAHNFFLLASQSYNGDIAADYQHSANWGLGDAAGHAHIINGENEIDKVGYGFSADSAETAPASNPSNNQSIERGLTGYDGDDNSIDFIIKNNPTPTNSSGDGMPDIVINEFLATGDAWQDFVEIYNGSNSAIDLDGWKLIIENDYGAGSITALSGSLLEEDWLVYYYNDDVLQASSTIAIYDNHENEIDKIFYVNIDIADKSFARIPDGSANWVDPIPTPGTANKLEQKGVAVIESADQAPDIKIVEQSTVAAEETVIAIQEEPAVNEQEIIIVESEIGLNKEIETAPEAVEAQESDTNIIADMVAPVDEIIAPRSPIILREDCSEAEITQETSEEIAEPIKFYPPLTPPQEGD